MTKQQKNELINTILKSCLFSEYLPSEFSTSDLSSKCFEFRAPNTSLAPIEFTMDKYNDLGNRRFISVPEIWSYINAINSLSDGNALQKILELNNKDEHSLSKIINEKKQIKNFSDGYGFYVDSQKEIVDIETEKDFSKNLELKIEKSKGCECILHLDISNFYNSIYTHNITTIIEGSEWATREYHKNNNHSNLYKVLSNIDSKLAAMNQKRTHGFLMGPRLSFILAESLLTRIDVELEEQLSRLRIDFVRYVDDYDVFLKNRGQIKEVEAIFNRVLQTYGLLLNDSKTKVENFPYYSYIDFNKCVKEEDGILDAYSKFSSIEKLNMQNGALLYFCQNILSQYTSTRLALSLSFSMLKNVSKSLMSCCKNIVNFNSDEEDKKTIRTLLIDLLKDFTKKQLDLECVWVLYTLLKLFPRYSIEDDTLAYDLNEICLVIYMYESKYGKQEEFIKERAKECGWLLNYELFYNNIICSEEFSNNLKLESIKEYEYLKKEKIHFYHKKATTDNN